jgi:hypothetical protein
VTRELLLDVLAQLGRASETPLQFGLDARALAAWALERHAARGGAGWSNVRGEAEGLLSGALGARIALGDDFAAAMARLHGVLRPLHPQAAAALAMRLEGWDAPEIAGRCETGARLVERVLRDAARELSA